MSENRVRRLSANYHAASRGEGVYNCYKYAFDTANELNMNGVTISCANVIRAVLRDNPDWMFAGKRIENLNHLVTQNDPAVFMIIRPPVPNSNREPCRRGDFHFYKRRNGEWTHKPGRTKNIQLANEAGAPIVNPNTACHGTYNNLCGYFVRKPSNNAMVPSTSRLSLKRPHVPSPPPRAASPLPSTSRAPIPPSRTTTRRNAVEDTHLNSLYNAPTSCATREQCDFERAVRESLQTQANANYARALQRSMNDFRRNR